MALKSIHPLLLLSTLLIVSLQPQFSTAQTVMKGGYWFPASGFAAADINSSLFTHLFCAFADVNPQTFQVTISSSNQPQFSSFTQTVQSKNPSVKTLLSIGGGSANVNTFSSMAAQPNSRKSFIDSSIQLARSNNFHGLDLDWEYPSDSTQMANFGSLITEWRAAVAAEATSSGKQRLLMSAAVLYLSYYYSSSVPYNVTAVSNSLDWINIMAYDFYGPGWSPSSTGPPAALFNPGNQESGDNGVKSWIQSGLPAKKIVLGFPFYGWSWRLTNANNNGLFAPANGSGLSGDGSSGYNQIKQFCAQSGATKVFNATIVTDYCYKGTTWIGYDDVQSISTKVTYAKGKGLLGYFAWHVGADDSSWTLSTKASQTWGGNVDYHFTEYVKNIAVLLLLFGFNQSVRKWGLENFVNIFLSEFRWIGVIPWGTSGGANPVFHDLDVSWYFWELDSRLRLKLSFWGIFNVGGRICRRCQGRATPQSDCSNIVLWVWLGLRWKPSLIG